MLLTPRLRALLAFLFPRSPAVGGALRASNMQVVIHYTSLIGCLGHASFVPLFLWLGVRPMAQANLASCAVFLFCFWLNRRGRSHAALFIGSAEVVGHAILATLYTGWTSGFHYYILGLAVLIFYSDRLRLALKGGLALLLAAVYLLLFQYTLQVPPLVPIGALQAQVTGTLNIVTAFLVLTALAYTFHLATSQAESALQAANRHLEIQALTDPLTCLCNRRNIQDRLEVALDAFRSYGLPFSVILADIDDFKAFNDRSGHEAGDIVLVHVAEILRGAVRAEDHVARWGGEEFLVLVSGGDLREAGLVAERLRAGVAAIELDFGGQRIKITMTLGVAQYAPPDTLDACISRADDAMYAGKRQGKNCVSLAQ